MFNRGTRDRPLWYGRSKDLGGGWKLVATRMPTKAQARQFVAGAEARVPRGLTGIELPPDSPRCRELMEGWLAGLTNRRAEIDRARVRKHLVPAFGELRISDVSLRRIMAWLDAQRTDAKLSPASQRQDLNALSRFFSWAIERGHTTANPVRSIPQGKRPRPGQRRDVPWLDDDAAVRTLVRVLSALSEPVGLMFYLGNRSGLRTGELCGLRISDLGFLGDGCIRVRFSYDGPLEEDRTGEGRCKWVPAPDDAAASLGPWLARRTASGLGPEGKAFAFPDRARQSLRVFLERTWQGVAAAHGLGAMTWYEAARHSFVARNLSRGATLDEVSSAVGRSSPVVTRRYYDHFVRREFSPGLRAGLGLGAEHGGTVTPIDAGRRRDG